MKKLFSSYLTVSLSLLTSVNVPAQPLSPKSYRVDDYDWNSAQAGQNPMLTYTYSEEKQVTDIETPTFQFYAKEESGDSSQPFPCAPPPSGPVVMCWFRYKTEGRITPTINTGRVSKQPQYVVFHVNRYDVVGVNKDGKVELRFGKSKITVQGKGKYASSLELHLAPQTFLKMSQAKSVGFKIDQESRSFVIADKYMKPLKDLAATLPQAKSLETKRPKK